MPGQPSSERMSTLSPARRRTFRVLGWCLLVPGILMFAAPFLAVPLAMTGIASGSTAGFGFVPFAFMFAFPGIILIIIGSTLLRFGYMKATADIVSTETQGAVENTTAAWGRGLGKGLQQSGFSLGGSAQPVVKVKCRSCGYLESEDARFCSQCAKAI